MGNQGRVRWRHSLVTRLLLTSMLITIVAVTATAWLATRTATQAIQQEQGRSLSDEKALYDALIGYGATHTDWSDVGHLLDEQAKSLDRRVTLTTPQRQVLADSLPTTVGTSFTQDARASATVDPLQLDLGLTGDTDSIDGRIVGPYRLNAQEKNLAGKMASDALNCVEKVKGRGRIVTAPSGRQVVVPSGIPDTMDNPLQCLVLEAPLPSEARSLKQLSRMVTACLGDVRPGETNPQMDWSTVPPTYSLIGKDGRPRTGRRALDCLDQSRRRQLDPYTADPVLLFVTDPHTGRSASVFTLSRANAQRIAVVSTGVLLIVLAVTVLLGRRLVRPLKTLTEAAVTHSPAPVTTQDEIGYLASSLNEATRQRDNAEAQRRAMVSDVAHELRSPLTNMRSWLEAAQDDLADIDRPLVDLLHDETIVLQRILEDLTDLAAADAGTLRVHPEPVVLADCLDQVVSAHISAAEDAGVRLTGEVAGSVTLEADPVRLRQLVGNLVSNGLRNTPSGGSVTVAGRLVDGRVVITVRDTGAGIAPEHLPKIFERFWRADQSRTRATGGSGLGLPIVRQLVESHGGRVSVASAVGRGSVFTVELPASHG